MLRVSLTVTTFAVIVTVCTGTSSTEEVVGGGSSVNVTVTGSGVTVTVRPASIALPVPSTTSTTVAVVVSVTSDAVDGSKSTGISWRVMVASRRKPSRVLAAVKKIGYGSARGAVSQLEQR